MLAKSAYSIFQIPSAFFDKDENAFVVQSGAEFWVMKFLIYMHFDKPDDW